MPERSPSSGLGAPLTPDQHATLSLLLRRHKRYGEVAEMLGISADAVRDRAHAALATIDPGKADALGEAERIEIGEYLLSQQDPAVAQQTESNLARSAPARAWAEAVSAELAKLGGKLPQIPPLVPSESLHGGGKDALAARSGGVEHRGEDSAPQGARSAAGSAEDGASFATDGARAPARSAAARPARSLKSSRLGGALLLGGIAVAAIVVIVLVLTGGGNQNSARKPASSVASTDKAPSGKTSPGATGATGATGSSTTPKLEAVAKLSSASSGSEAAGILVIASESGKQALVFSAKHLAPSKGFSYVLWFLSSNGKAKSEPFNTPKVGTKGTMEAVGPAPAKARAYDRVELTQETETRPKAPSEDVVLSGPLEQGKS